ncbi:tubulin polyglutamylase complex subunit 1-like [Littorina saxatilis]|uniref:Tubulin polyglutamylase complex subunit 1-like C-terminal domain-containing protein n=1 Tax=Littorina saxatilis TaxID=31220 RepID=A0AAN9BWX8_9CAEN
MAAERRKAIPSTSDDNKPLDSDKQFLERTNVNAVVRDVLGKIIANRPEDPVTFLADYFEALVEEQSSLVQRALRVITMTHHSRPVFEVNVRDSYNLLSKHKVNKKLKGVNGSVYTELLQALCRNLPSSVTIKLVQKLECFEHEAVPYDVFRSSIFACCVLREYAFIAEQLFASLDIQKIGKADKALCDAVMDQLKTALGSSRNDVRRIIESSYNLAPEGLHQALERALSREQTQGVCTSEHFITEACDSFLAKVKKLK